MPCYRYCTCSDNALDSTVDEYAENLMDDFGLLCLLYSIVLTSVSVL